MKGNDIQRTEATKYSEAYKRKIIEEYLRSGTPKLILQRKYGIRFKSAISTWMKKLGYEDIHRIKQYLPGAKESILTHLNPVNKDKESPQDKAALEKRVRELERALENEKLCSEALRLTIEIAEKELNIPIRKK